MMLNTSTKTSGFSLIEMMIGLAVGLLGLLAVTTIYVEFSKHRTVETSLMEAQSNGALALFLLERDLDRAGYGYMAMQSCTCIYDNGGGPTTQTRAFCEKNTSDAIVRAQSVVPLVITDGGAASDSLFIQYGNPLGGLPVTSILAKQINFTDAFKLKSTAGIVPNEIFVLNRANICAAYQATAISEADKTVSHDAGAGIINPAAQPSVGYDTALPNDYIIDLGRYVSKNFHIDANAAQLMENTSPTYTNDTPVVDDIVYMKADIGRDTDGDKLVNIWDKPVNIANYSQVIAIRVGIVARTQVKDRESPTAATLVVLPAVTGGNQQTYTVPDTKYRYKVYYTIIPLRNMLWN